MKLFKVLLLVLCCSTQVFAGNEDPVVITVEGKEIKLSEFLAVYNKNNKSENVDKQSLEEYLELFVNFKLRVNEALDQKLDTISKFQDELEGYRKQLVQPYLVDKDTKESMIKEAYDRMTSDVKAKHILVRVDAGAAPEDTLAAWNKISKIRKAALKNKDFESVMLANADRTEQKTVIAEDLGYFSAFGMVYDFETAAYNTAVGEVSEIVRTSFGYHILKIYDKRPARGQIRVAHIMVAINSIAPDEKQKLAEKKINEIYAKIQEGASFETMVRSHSDDQGSVRKNGAMPWFGTGKMVTAFEDAAFELKADGEISKPIRTKFGWHIIKRLERKEIKSFDDSKLEIKNLISKDGRASKSRKALVKNLKQEYGFKMNVKAKNTIFKAVDGTYLQGGWDKERAAGLNEVLFTLKDNKYSNTSLEVKQQEFIKYLAGRQRKNVKRGLKDVVEEHYAKFEEQRIVDFEEKVLPFKYPAYKALLEEYRDGILLFELLDKNVWSKAVKDTAGLRAFYNENTEKFMWDTRVEASIYNCSGDKVYADALKLALKQVKKGFPNEEILEKINAESQLNLRITKKKFLKLDNEIIDKVIWSPGVKEVEHEGKKYIVVVHAKLAPEVKTLKESKGLVTAEYQNYLEKEWNTSLRAKYKYSVNKDALKTVE